jgi:predicted GTPase
MVRHPIQKLRGELLNVVDLLEQNAFYTLSAEEAKARMEQAQTLLQKIDSIESSFLWMGLLGGTGVGKSTLMNGLAGAEIASASHRRPHTDHVLIYRHAQAHSLPSLTLTDIAWREIEHDGLGAETIVLCDLPDFDSLMGDHRETVIRFLEQLDLLIWVASPEKYADQRFYEFLKQVPKASTNFWFVLNKADLFFEGVSLRVGYENMEGAVKRFREHIHANGIPKPVVFVLSARDALGGHETTPWNQFALFKEQVFQQRDSKTIAAAKEANVDAEVLRYLSGFRSEVRNLEHFQEIIQHGLRELQEEHTARSEAVGRVLKAWLVQDIHQMLPESSLDFEGLVGLGNSLALLFHRSNPRERGERQRSDDQTHGATGRVPGFASSVLRQELEFIADRLQHRLLRQGFPTPLRDRLAEVLDIEERLKKLEGAFVRVVDTRTVDSAAPRSLGFRFGQHLTYFVLLAFLLIAIGGETAWRQLVMEFGLRNAFLLLLAMTETIFSAKGLAALSSYALLNLFVAFRFYRRTRRRMRRRRERQLETLETALKEVWEDELDKLLDDLNQLGEAIQATKAALTVTGTEQGIHDAETKS